MFQRVLFALMAAVLVSCAQTKEDFGPRTKSSQRNLELSAKERAKRLSNELFEAVWNGADDIEKIVKKTPALLQARNDEGDTPLGFALREGRLEISEQLLRHTTPQNLFELNKDGESYVFLAARSGFHGLISQMADLYYNSLGSLQDFEFGNLDQENHKGQRALFVAANRQVAEVLEIQYYRGRLEYPFWQFTLKEDQSTRGFLHTAAAEGREDVIAWAADRICAPGSWQDEETSWWLRWPATALEYGLRGAQTHLLGDLNLPTDLLFNRRDQDGRTPLHVAILEKRWNSLRALAHCQWVDYDLADGAGDYPLHSFLKSLNPFQSRIEDEVRQAFDFLSAQGTHLRLSSATTRVNRKDHDGNTALHLAARMADPYFYRALEKLGDVHAVNAKGESARDIFNLHHPAAHAR